MRSEGPEREQLDEAVSRHVGELPLLVMTPYIAAYLIGVFALSGAINPGGLFVVILAVLLIGSSMTPWRRWRPSTAAVRLAVIGASTLLGVLVAVLAAEYGIA